MESKELRGEKDLCDLQYPATCFTTKILGKLRLVFQNIQSANEFS